MALPILYSLRNCPFAMRARLAIYKAKQPVELRDVNLKNKPPEMIMASAKATVPIIVLSSTQVIDESLDVMLWALAENDPENLLRCTLTDARDVQDAAEAEANTKAQMLMLIHQFDKEFKNCLEQYKCAKRYHESNLIDCRQACEIYIQDLEARLTAHQYLIDNKESCLAHA